MATKTKEEYRADLGVDANMRTLDWLACIGAEALAERDAALARVAELERLRPSDAVRNSLAIVTDTEPTIPIDMLMQRALDRVRLLQRELENAHARIAELVSEDSDAEVEGPFRFKWIGASHFTLFEADQWLIIVTDRSCEMPPERLVRLLNLGVRADQLQRDAEFCRSQYREQMSRADAAEAREKALLELKTRAENLLKLTDGPSSIHLVARTILDEADQSPEAN